MNIHEFPFKDYFGGLRREFKFEPYPVSIKIAEKIHGTNLMDINEWDIYADGHLFLEIIETFKEVIEDNKLEGKIDLFCSAGASGMGLAFALGQKLNKKVITFNEKAKNHFYADEFLPDCGLELKDKRVCIVDSVLKSGYVANKCYHALKRKDAKPQSILTILFNQRYYTERIDQQLRDITYYPLLIWNQSVKDRFSNDLFDNEIPIDFVKEWKERDTNYCPDEDESNIHVKQREKKIGRIRKLFDFLREEFKDRRFQVDQAAQEINQLLDAYYEEIDETAKDDIDYHKYHYLQLLDAIRHESFSSFCLANYVDFSEAQTKTTTASMSGSQARKATSHLGNETSNKIAIKPLDRTDMTHNDFDALFTVTLFNSLISREDTISKEFVSLINEVVINIDLKKNMTPLRDFFKKTCFTFGSNTPYNNLERFLSKIFYSMFEDVFYSKRYLKNHRYIDRNLGALSNSMDQIVGILTNEKGDRSDQIIRTFDLFYKSIISEKRKPEYWIPQQPVNIIDHMELLFAQYDDVDEWTFFMDPSFYFEIVSKITDFFEGEFNWISPKSRVILLSLGMSGIPTGFGVRNKLYSRGYKEIPLILMEEKIFSPSDNSFKPSLINELPKDGDPVESLEIFLFDSVIKTGFNRSYALDNIDEIIKTKKPDFDVKIHYITLKRLKDFEEYGEDGLSEQDRQMKSIDYYEVVKSPVLNLPKKELNWDNLKKIRNF